MMKRVKDGRFCYAQRKKAQPTHEALYCVQSSFYADKFILWTNLRGQNIKPLKIKGFEFLYYDDFQHCFASVRRNAKKFVINTNIHNT